MTRRVAVDDVAEHNRRMWDRLSAAGIPYTRPQGTPPRTDRAKRRFLDPNDRLAGLPIKGQRVLALAGGGGWHPVVRKMPQIQKIQISGRDDTNNTQTDINLAVQFSF